MLETNYMVRHPGSQIALSRGALERDAIADRFLRLIRGEPRNLENGGLAVELLALIRQNGLLAEDDFHDVLDPDPIFSAIEQNLTDRNCEGFCRPGNRVGLPGLDGGGRSPAEPVSGGASPGASAKIPWNQGI